MKKYTAHAKNAYLIIVNVFVQEIEFYLGIRKFMLLE